MSESRRVVPIPIFIDVHDVMASMKCGRATAYAHMRRAIGRKPGERGALRVEVYRWQRYVDSLYGESSATLTPTKTALRSPLKVTLPRTKPRERRLNQ